MLKEHFNSLPLELKNGVKQFVLTLFVGEGLSLSADRLRNGSLPSTSDFDRFAV